MVPREGFEPPTCGIEAHCSNPLSYRGVPNLIFKENHFLVRVERIELSSPAWKASIIATIQHPLVLKYYTRFIKNSQSLIAILFILNSIPKFFNYVRIREIIITDSVIKLKEGDLSNKKNKKNKPQPTDAKVHIKKDSAPDEVSSLTSIPEKKDPQKSITLGELILGLIIIGLGFFMGYKKYISTKNQAEDTAKLYKSEAMSANLALFFNEKSYYPTTDQLKDETWLTDNAPKLAILGDDGFNNEIGGDNYKYDVLPEGCDNGDIKCDGYKITINPSSDEEIIEQLGGSYQNYEDSNSEVDNSELLDGATDNPY